MTILTGLAILFVLAFMANGPRWLAVYTSGNEGGAIGAILGTFLFYWIIIALARLIARKLSRANPRAIFWTTIGVLFFLCAGTLGQWAKNTNERIARNKIEMALCDQDKEGDLVAICTYLIDSRRFSGRDLAALHNNRGLVELKLTQWDEAIRDFSRVIELAPDMAAVRANRCFAHKKNFQLLPALDDCSRAIALDPKLAAAWYTRGQIKAMIDAADGIADLEQAAKLDPDNRIFAEALGQIRERGKK